MEELSRVYLTNPKRVQVAPPGKVADKITQSLHFVEKEGKTALLRRFLTRNPDAQSLVFARTKHGAEKLMKQLVSDGFDAASIHGNKSQGQRDRAIGAFRDNRVKILVATDVAARGLDIPGVGFVFNYDLPEVPDNYVHRIGRTARAGREGEAIAFCSAEEIGYLRQIEKVMKATIPVGGGERPEEVKPQKSGRGGGGGGGRGGNGGGGRPQQGQRRRPQGNANSNSAPGAGDGAAKRKRPRRRPAA
jgi:ATP-dependent RNA helicase RhlE